jgi:hypothetical protein
MERERFDLPEAQLQKPRFGMGCTKPSRRYGRHGDATPRTMSSASEQGEEGLILPDRVQGPMRQLPAWGCRPGRP